MKIYAYCLLFLGGLLGQHLSGQRLTVYDSVPGLQESEHYSFKIRETNSSNWKDPFAFITRCIPKADDNQFGYYNRHIGDWSHTFINFEIEDWTEVEIEISKADGSDINSMEVRPLDKIRRATLRDGKVYVIIDRPAMFTVDIDGQMDQPTGRILESGWDASSFYDGPPIHALTVFANPVIEDKPSMDDPGVHVVFPEDVSPPQHDGNWDTLYFAPGVHDIGNNFHVHKDRSYYIPGDAVVHGTFNNRQDHTDGSNIRIFGHGVISGERFVHPKFQDPEVPDTQHYEWKPISLSGARGTTVEGITIMDSAMHSMLMYNDYKPEDPTTARWVKIITWRTNGDGSHAFQNGLFEDSFFRTADDSIYIGGLGIRRCQFWNDVNGSALVFSYLGGVKNPDIIVEDCDILYSRSIFPPGSRGGGIFNMRGEGGGAEDSSVTLRNIKVWETYMNKPAFILQMSSSYLEDPDYSYVRGAGDLSGVLFQNITIPGTSFLGYPEILWGDVNAQIEGLVFDNVRVAGGLLTSSSDYFTTNAYVSGLQYLAPTQRTNAFTNAAGSLKWDEPGNWTLNEVPRPLDDVTHLAVSGTLEVNSTSYAGSLDISNSASATLRLLPYAKMQVSGNVALGNSGANGVGRLVIDGGDLTVGGNIDVGIFGAGRQGECELNQGSITVQGDTALGGWNETTTGTLNIQGGYFNQTGGRLFIGRNGNGTVNVTGGYLDITSTEWNPLKIATAENSADGTLNVYDGKVITPGITMDGQNADTGSSRINLYGGTLQIEKDSSSGIQIYDDADIHMESGLLVWKGDRVSDMQALIAGDFITISGGRSPSLNATPEYQWTNGSSILNVDYDEVNPGYTTVWVSSGASWLTEGRLWRVADGAFTGSLEMKFNISVFDDILRFASIAGDIYPENSIDATVPGQIVDYRFASVTASNQFQSSLTSGGLSSPQTATTTATRHYIGSQIYTSTNPQPDWSSPHDFGDGGTSGNDGGVQPLWQSTVDGSIDISGLGQGSVYFVFGLLRERADPQIEVSLSGGADTVDPVTISLNSTDVAWYVGNVNFANNSGHTTLNYSMSVSTAASWLGTVVVTPPTASPRLISIIDDQGGADVPANESLSYTIQFSKDVDPATVNTSDFGNAAGAPYIIESVDPLSPGVFRVTVRPVSAGPLRLMINQNAELLDTFGQALDTSSALFDDTQITVTTDNVLPTLSSADFIGDMGGGAVMVGTTITYTIDFSEDMDSSTFQYTDLRNAGTASVTIGTPTETEPGRFTVAVTAESLGTIQLELISGADLRDTASNPIDLSDAIESGNFYRVELADASVTHVHVILLGGQSNAWGKGNSLEVPTSPINFQGPQDTVDLFQNSYMLDLGPRNFDSRMGAEIALGYTLARSLSTSTTARVAILKYAVGGTNLYQEWKAGGDGSTTGDGPLYVNFQNNTTAGLSALANKYPGATINIDGMLWVQGEADLNQGRADEYEANLTAFIADVRATYGSDLPFVISRLSDSQVDIETNSDAVILRTAQTDVAAADNRAYLLDTDGFSVYFGDEIHYDAPGVQSIGFAAADLLLPSIIYKNFAGEPDFKEDANQDGVSDGMAWLLGAFFPADGAHEQMPTSTTVDTNYTFTLQSLTAEHRHDAWMALEYSSDLGMTDPWSNHRILIPDTTGTIQGIDFQITPNGSLQDVQIIIPASLYESEEQFFFRFSGGIGP